MENVEPKDAAFGVSDPISDGVGPNTEQVQLAGCRPGEVCWATIPVSPGRLTTVTAQAKGGEQLFIMSIDPKHPPQYNVPLTNQKVDIVSTTFAVPVLWIVTGHRTRPGEGTGALPWTANQITVVPPMPSFPNTFTIYGNDGIGGGCDVWVTHA